MYTYRSNSTVLSKLSKHSKQIQVSMYIELTQPSITSLNTPPLTELGALFDFLAPGLHLCCQDDLTELGGLAKHPAANIIKSFAERKPCVD